jgi:uncharacterized Fe-S cluster-containing radical SAM superfamily enzyme
MSLRNKFIDPEKIFTIYWQEMGAGRSLAKLHEQFPINPKTGRKVTRDAGYKAMWRWACRPENYTKAHNIFRSSMLSTTGELWTDERFKAELKEKARWVLTPRQYKSWYNGSIIPEELQTA